MDQKTKKRIFQVALFLGTAISMFFVPWLLVKAWILPLPDTVQEQLDQAVGHGFEGVIVYVDQAGQPPQYYASGWHDREAKIPADAHALFKIASMDKLYTAVVITKLAAQQRVELDKPIIAYFPEFKGKIANADKITVRMLVQHRSGLPNVTDTPNFWTDPPKSSQESLERIFGIPVRFDPGEKYEYCNTNYLLLSMLIEKITGKPKYEMIREGILEPLGLKNTYGSIHDIDMDRLMSGYYVGVDEDIKTTDYGAMVATAEDVGIFIRALNTGVLLTPEEQELYASLYAYEHGGLIPGYQSLAAYDKESDAVIVQFMNTTDFEGYQWNLSQIVFGRIEKIVARSGAE
ncbi:serine hydrolase domain-containing protein [Robertkochia sediminum]|uniref:serine hydrolase domain-containing protein n=1 Tax=Robertkochia sediminum TaxID=2785326 RepID=UPI001931505B|nr:serine hydrolase domain-containing protein [Robertkochia sediminum]MBL7472024.1 beta-lactamase family protein [Robertkochia sediminum]